MREANNRIDILHSSSFIAQLTVLRYKMYETTSSSKHIFSTQDQRLTSDIKE